VPARSTTSSSSSSSSGSSSSSSSTAAAEAAEAAAQSASQETQEAVAGAGICDQSRHIFKLRMLLRGKEGNKNGQLLVTFH